MSNPETETELRLMYEEHQQRESNYQTMLQSAILKNDSRKTMEACISGLTSQHPIETRKDGFMTEMLYDRVTPAGDDLYELLDDYLSDLRVVHEIRLVETGGSNWETDDVVVVVR
jgi:hypothetical protein